MYPRIQKTTHHSHKTVSLKHIIECFKQIKNLVKTTFCRFLLNPIAEIIVYKKGHLGAIQLLLQGKIKEFPIYIFISIFFIKDT